MATSQPKGKKRTTEERFESAVSVIRSLPKDGPYQPSNMIKLKFYGLYKQAKEGPNTSPKPGFWDPAARAKWEAWNMCGNMGREQAMKMYVRELEQLVETMPHTQEVEHFLQMIGPFYEIVEDKNGTGANTGECDTVGGDSDTVGGDSDTVGGDSDAVGGDNNTVGGDSDGELEYEDSYDNLPEHTPTHSKPPLRQDTPYVKKLTPIAMDTLDTGVIDTSLMDNNNDGRDGKQDREKGVRFSNTVAIRTPITNSAGEHMDQVTAMLHQIQQSLQVINSRLHDPSRHDISDWRNVIFYTVNIIALGAVRRNSSTSRHTWWVKCIWCVAIAWNAWLIIKKMCRVLK